VIEALSLTVASATISEGLHDPSSLLLLPSPTHLDLCVPQLLLVPAAGPLGYIVLFKPFSGGLNVKLVEDIPEDKSSRGSCR